MKMLGDIAQGLVPVSIGTGSGIVIAAGVSPITLSQVITGAVVALGGILGSVGAFYWQRRVWQAKERVLTLEAEKIALGNQLIIAKVCQMCRSEPLTTGVHGGRTRCVVPLEDRPDDCPRSANGKLPDTDEAEAT